MMHFLFRQRKVHEMPKISSSLLLLAFSSVGLATPPFKYDQQLAIDLARAYVQSQFRQRPDNGNGRIGYDKPAIVAMVDSKGRHLVSVTFASAPGGTGAYAVLEQCEENGLLLGVDVGTVDNLENYRRDMKSVNSKTYVALPRVCPETDAP
jgi:hypothetical protein